MASQQPPTVPESYQAWVNRGNDWVWTNEWQQAALAYQRAIALHDQDPNVFINLGLALSEAGQPREARDAYQQAIRLSSADERELRQSALRRLVDLHAALGEPTQAASTCLQLADSYMQSRQPAQAVRAWQQAVRHEPTNRAAYRRLAEAYQRGRRLDLAAQATLALARVHADAGDREEAQRLAQRTLTLEPDFAPAHQLLAFLQDAPTASIGPGTSTLGSRSRRRSTGGLRREGTPPRLGETSGGATGPLDWETLEREQANERDGRESGPSPKDAAQQRALVRLAETIFDGGGTVDLRIESLKAQGIGLQARGLVEEAARTFAEVIRAGGGSAEVFYTLGTLYQTMLRLDDAIAQFRRVQDAPDYASGAWFAIGQCLQHQGRSDEALTSFQEALRTVNLDEVGREQADEVIRLYEGLSDSYEATGDREQADHCINDLVEWLTGRGWEDKLVELRARLGGDPGLVEVFDTTASEEVLHAMNAARKYEAQGRFRAAVDELYWALPTAPFYLPLHLLLADLYLHAGRTDEGIAKLVMVADVAVVRGNAKQGIGTFERILEVSPSEQAVRARLIDLLMLHGEIDQALEHYLQLAEGFYQMAQGDRAIEKLNEALRLAPRSATPDRWALNLQRRLADIHTQRLDWRRAVAAYESIHVLQPTDEEAAQQLAALLFRLGASERAVALITHTADALLEEEGSFAMLRFLEAQADQHPDEPEPLRLLGQAQAELGDTLGAAQQWERALERFVRRGERAQGAALVRRMIALHTAHEPRYRAMLQHLMAG